MNSKVQSILAALITITGILLTSLVGYYAFIFPKTIKIWQEQEKSLSIYEQQLVQFSQFCTSFALILIPLYVLMTLAGFIWLVLALKGKNGGDNLKPA